MDAIREEVGRLCTIEERHRRLASRLVLLFLATIVVDLAGAVAMYALERSARGTQVTTFGQALFFATAQVLTISSSLANPVTALGRVVDRDLLPHERRVVGRLGLQPIAGAISRAIVSSIAAL